jgi:hypothetical protein
VLDVDDLASRFAGRPAELSAALTALEQRAAGILSQIDASLRRADAQELRAHLAELRAALEVLSSRRIGDLADELEALSGRGLFGEASAALRALEGELAACVALGSQALARAATSA